MLTLEKEEAALLVWKSSIHRIGSSTKFEQASSISSDDFNQDIIESGLPNHS